MAKWILIALGAAVVLFIFIYNRIIGLIQRRKSAFSDIDVQLRLRYDLVPNLVETVKGYAAHEKGLFENVTEARSRAMKAGGAGAERLAAENALGQAMMGLFAVAENYPQLKADGNFQKLQGELSDIENKIAAARRYFNNTTHEYNAAIQQFPAVLVSGIMGWREESFFELDAATAQAVKEAPKVAF